MKKYYLTYPMRSEIADQTGKIVGYIERTLPHASHWNGRIDDAGSFICSVNDFSTPNEVIAAINNGDVRLYLSRDIEATLRKEKSR